MPNVRRPRVAPTDDWQQLQLLSRFPEQRVYELLRPVVLFGHSPAERARQTGTPERTLYRQAARFETYGMASLFAPAAQRQHRLPEEIRQAILQLKAEYAPLSAHEIAVICSARFGRRPSPHTVKRILAEEPVPTGVPQRYPPYHAIINAAERRLAIIRLHSEGRTKTSIAGYLGIDRRTVSRTLQRWIDEGVLGLDDKSHARKDSIRKVDLRAMLAVRALQENPELGEFRIHAALKQLGIELSPRNCGLILALNRRLYGLRGPARTEHTPKEMPFRGRRRHQYWTVDIRYLDHGLDDERIYCISILENYSRAILASGLARRQDLAAYLMVLFAAIRQHGAPEALVSDGGGVFRAKQAQHIYDRVGVLKLTIEPRQSWQSYIETAFNVQRRMADWHFAQATTWAELVTLHDQWVANYNYQVHWAHRERENNRHSAAEVLGWVHGQFYTPEELHRIFYATRFGRVLNRFGYVRFRHWRLCGERGWTGNAVAVWLYGEHLTIAFADEALAQHGVTYKPDQRQLATVVEEHRFETPYQLPQLALWDPQPDERLTVVRVAPSAPRRPRPLLDIHRLRLFADELADPATG